MRHRKSGRHLNRSRAHYHAMFRNMSASLVQHELIRTTLPKAKELRRIVEPLITRARVDTVANRRLAFARLRDRGCVAKLFAELGPGIGRDREDMSASSSAAIGPETGRPWPMSSWSIDRSMTRSSPKTDEVDLAAGGVRTEAHRRIRACGAARD